MSDNFRNAFKNKIPREHTQAIGVFYVTDSKDFELLTISFPELEKLMNALPSFEETEDWDKEKRAVVMREYCGYDNTIDALRDELDCNDVIERICNALWEVSPEPKFYVLKFDLEYEWTYDSFNGESDFEVDFTYTAHALKDEWKNVDLYDKGTILYSREFDTNKESVVVTGLREIIDEEPLYDGVYYVTEKDVNGVKEEVLIEMNDENWFASPELANEAIKRNTQTEEIMSHVWDEEDEFELES